MAWRERPSLSPDEARQLHAQALVIDSQQPPVTSGFLFTEHMREQLEAWRKEGLSRADVAQAVQMLTTREIQTSAEARRIYRDFWRRSGVTVACGTYSGSHRLSQSFEASVRAIAQAHAFIAHWAATSCRCSRRPRYRACSYERQARPYLDSRTRRHSGTIPAG